MKRWIYRLLRYHNDYEAVKRGRIARRVGRRVAGKALGKGMRRLFK
jgi:hypothetical protein